MSPSGMHTPILPQQLRTTQDFSTAAWPAGGKTSKIGIVHNVMEYETLRPEAFSARWVDPVVVWLNRVWATQTTLDYFSHGHFSWMSPWSDTMAIKEERPGLDFVGMNYYGK